MSSVGKCLRLPICRIALVCQRESAWHCACVWPVRVGVGTGAGAGAGAGVCVCVCVCVGENVGRGGSRGVGMG